MSNYVKSVDFAAKDALLTGNPLKIVSGTEIDDEYNAIQTAINSKANTNSPSLTGSPTAPTATAGTNTSQIATTAFVTSADNNLLISPAFSGTPTAPTANASTDSTQIATTAFVKDVLETYIYPIGSIYTNATNSTNPATLLGFGTWVPFAEGRVMAGLDSADIDFDTAEKTGGNKTHTLTVDEIPSHDHKIDEFNSGENQSQAWKLAAAPDGNEAGGSEVGGNTTLTGVQETGGGNSHSIVQPYITVYMWKRTA